MVTMSFENEDVTPDGKSAADCARALVDAGADIVGLNCLRSPEYTFPLAREMRQAVKGYIACQPVAYRTTHDHRDFTSLPAFPDQLDPFQLSRREMADYATKARDLGVNYIGACCGAVASHIREMARALGKISADDRIWKKGGENQCPPRILRPRQKAKVWPVSSRGELDFFRRKAPFKRARFQIPPDASCATRMNPTPQLLGLPPRPPPAALGFRDLVPSTSSASACADRLPSP
jgi:hypothetical protein